MQWKGKNLFFWGDGIIYNGQYELLSGYNFDYFFAPINGRDKKREEKGIIGNINEHELADFCSKLSIKHIEYRHVFKVCVSKNALHTFEILTISKRGSCEPKCDG